MSVIDISELLKDLTAEQPCGEDLEYDPDFGELERAAAGKPEQQIGDSLIQAQEADWPDVRKKAIALFSRTKDIRIAVILTQSLLMKEGMVGFNEGLALVQGLLENHWDTVHPQLDAEDNNDPTLRINTLLTLCDHDTFLLNMSNTVLVSSKAFGKISLREIQISQGKIAAPSGTEDKVKDSAAINGAFQDADLEQLKNTADAVDQSIKSIKAIEALLMDKVGSKQAVNFKAVTDMLRETHKIMAEQLSQLGVTDESVKEPDSETAQTTGKAPTQSMSGAINSRDDVVKVIDMACEYFKKHEPSSPVPLLLLRAKGLIKKDFMDIIRDLTPAGLKQAEEIIGVGKK